MDYTTNHKVIGVEPCGCKVIKHPDKDMNPFIHYCPKHKSASDLYEALKDLATCFRNIEILSNVTDEFEKHSLGIAVDEMTKALAKAEGK